MSRDAAKATDRRRLILASRSPRRRRLLTEAGYIFDAVEAPFDDTHLDLSGVAPARAAEALAYLKATSLADTSTIHPANGADAPPVILAADTIVCLGDRQLGKPADRDAARRMLDLLLGRAHRVVSGVALLDPHADRVRLFHETAWVTIEHPGEAELDRYLDAGEWSGKAGGYNLAELEPRWGCHVEGDPATVIGLPLRALPQELQAFAIRPDQTRSA